MISEQNLSHLSRRDQDKLMIRGLAREFAEIANLPVQQEKKRLWKDLNQLSMKRPMVMVYSFPWIEAEKSHPELLIRSSHPVDQEIERFLKRMLFKWRYLKADMCFDPVYLRPVFMNGSAIRLSNQPAEAAWFSYCSNIHVIDQGNPSRAQAFRPVIHDEDDIERIMSPNVVINSRLTELYFERSAELLHPFIKVRKCGVQSIPFAPIDELASLWGIEALMIDMVERPELIHRAMEKIVSTYIKRLEQLITLDLLATNHVTAGSITQGMGESITDELPDKGLYHAGVKPENMWGGTAAQIMAGVSPQMHERFALDHEAKWLERFGLSAYGCCEPLHKKIDMLKKIKNLRKISMSSWIDIEEAADKIGKKYIFSYKPNPTFLAFEPFDLAQSKKELETVLSKTSEHGCQLEVILRTIISYRSDPDRIKQWVDMAMNLVGARP